MLHYGSPSLVIDPNQWTILALHVVQTRGEAIRRCACGVGWGFGYDLLHGVVLFGVGVQENFVSLAAFCARLLRYVEV